MTETLNSRESIYWNNMKRHFVGSHDSDSTLGIDYGPIGDAEIPFVVRDVLHYKPRLSYLMLKGCHYTDVGVRYLSKHLLRDHATLAHVFLHVNNITSGSIGVLVDALLTMPCLETVSLDTNPLSDRALPALLRLVGGAPRLQILTLNSTGLSVRAQRKLAVAAERNFSITDLRLDMHLGADEDEPWQLFTNEFLQRNVDVLEDLRALWKKRGDARQPLALPASVMTEEERAIIEPPAPTRAPKRSRIA